MRSSAHIKGHPIHPMLVAFPVAYLLGAAAIDACAMASGRKQWFRTARHMTKLGLGAALAAAVPGLVDYTFAVPPRSSARQRATSHMLSNLSALALFRAALSGRRTRDDRPAWWAMGAEACGAALIGVAGWMGGTLVYRNQIGVDHRYANAGRWQPAALPPPAPGDTLDAGAADELDVNQMKLLRVGAERIAVARTESGLAAFHERCTHKGGPLSDGTLACGVVQCPWHGSQFDVHTGEVKQGPAKQPIETCPVQEADGRIRVSL